MNPTYQSGFYAPGRGTAKYPALWDGCVGAWNPGLGNTGLSLRDWSGSQNNGTLIGGPTWGVTDGRQALSFDGGYDYVDAGNSSSLDLLDNFTILAWIKRTGFPAHPMIVVKGNSHANNNYQFFLNHVEGYKIALWFSDSSSDWSTIYANTIVSSNVWHHVVAVYNNSTNTVTFYLDGIADGTKTIAGTPLAKTPSLRIGSRAPDFYFSGQIDDTRIYNRALSPNEIRLLAQRPGIAYERAPRKFYSLPAAAGNPTGILINNLQSIRLGL